jgi:apolipoprotein N-acyltransferase
MVIFRVICSALMHSVAFVWPCSMGWLIFISLLPLQGLKPSRPMVAGFFWGALYYGLMLVGLVPFLHTFIPKHYILIPYSALVIYFSTISACWFYAAQRWGWLISTLCYYAYLQFFCLIPFGQFNGIPLTCPIVPLAHYTWAVQATSTIGVLGLTAVLVILQWSLTQSRLSWLVPCAFFLPFLQGLLVHQAAPHNLGIAYVAPVTGQSLPCDVAQTLADRIAMVRSRYPTATTIVFPEGTFQCLLHKIPAAIDILAQAAGPAQLVLGSHRQEGHCFYNCMYTLKEGVLQHCYDKVRCVPFAEYIPWPWSQIPGLSGLCLQGYEELTPSTAGTQVCLLAAGTVIPQICYDLYFCPHRPNAPDDIPILLLTNDAWYPAYLQELLLLLARVRAIAWGRDIWYVAHTRGLWLGKKGGLAILAQ